MHLWRSPWNFRIKGLFKCWILPYMIALQPDSFKENHKTTMVFSGSKIGLLQNADWKLITYLLALK